MTYYVPFFIHLESRRVDIVGITARSERAMDAADRPQCDRGWLRQRSRANRAPIISVNLLEMSSISMQ